MKTIGVLGGMGPEASATFYNMIINICHKKYNAQQDTDYPPMIIYSLPLEGFDETGIVDQEKVLRQLIKGIKVLESSGSDFIVIACNTVHCFIDELRKNVKIPILSIIEETSNKLKLDKINIMGGKNSISDRKTLLGIINNIDKKGIKAVILGCTELPLIISQKHLKLKIYDTLNILAESSIE